jgi:hypothetical protein
VPKNFIFTIFYPFAAQIYHYDADPVLAQSLERRKNAVPTQATGRKIETKTNLRSISRVSHTYFRISTRMGRERGVY